jgi:tetratricopeptide (TPR) repeat protein
MSLVVIVGVAEPLGLPQNRFDLTFLSIQKPQEFLKKMSTINQLYKEAEQLKDQGKLVEAKDRLEQLLGEAPDHVLSHLTLARIYTQLGNHEAAVKHAEKACEVEPTEGFNYTILSVTYQKAWAGTQDQQYIRLAEDALARSQMLGG